MKPVAAIFFLPAQQKQNRRAWPGGSDKSGEGLFSRAVTSQVSLAQESLTAVFGMGTGVASPLYSPEWLRCTALYPQDCIRFGRKEKKEHVEVWLQRKVLGLHFAFASGIANESKTK